MYLEHERRDNFIVLGTCIVLVILLGLTVFMKGGYVFSSNDDVMLKAIVNGSYTGSPDAHMIYVMFPLGLILKGLYSITTAVAWFDLLMVGLHFLCLALIMWRLSALFEMLPNRIAAAVVAAGVFLLLDFQYMMLSQYTALAGVVGATAVFWIATYRPSWEARPIDSIVIIFLLVMCLWLRKQVFLMIFPIALFALFSRFYRSDETVDERFEKSRHLWIPLGILAALVGISFLMEAIGYHSPEWKEFLHYNKARTEVVDYNHLPEYESNTEFYDSLGITESEYKALCAYDYLLVENLDAATLDTIADRQAQILKEWSQYYSVPRKVLRDTVSSMLGLCASPMALFATLAFVISVAVYMMRDNKWLAAIITIVYMYSWLFIGLFAYLGRMADRVSHGLFFALLLMYAGLMLDDVLSDFPGPSPSRFWQIGLSVIALLILSVSGFWRLLTTKEEKLLTDVKIYNWEAINNTFSQSDAVFLLDNSVIANVPERVFTKSYISKNAILLGNWTMGGPLETKKENLMLKGSVLSTLATDERACYVTESSLDPSWVDAILEDNGYDGKLTLSYYLQIPDTGAEYAVYQVK